MVKDDVKLALTEGNSLLQGVPSGIALIYTQAQVPPTLHCPTCHVICLAFAMCRNSDLHVPRCTSARWYRTPRLTQVWILPPSTTECKTSEGYTHPLPLLRTPPSHLLTLSATAVSPTCAQVCPPHPRDCKKGGVSKKWGHRMPRGGTSGHGYGAAAFVQSCSILDIFNYHASKDAALVGQVAVYNLFPRAYTSLVSHNASLDLHVADSHATNGQSDVGLASGLSHVHITGKANASSVGPTWHCDFHVDDDANQHEHTHGADSERASSTHSLGVWWPANIDPERDTVRFVFECCGYLPLEEPIAIVWNSTFKHGSYSTFLPAGADVVGTSTESAKRAVLRRLKNPHS